MVLPKIQTSSLQGRGMSVQSRRRSGRTHLEATAQTYQPRNHRDVLEVENATSRRHADRGGDSRPFSGSGVPTIWLEVEESSAAIMADWPWESANASSSQQAFPKQSSPLQSSSSQSSHEAMQRTSQYPTQPPLDAPGPGVRGNSFRNSLVETLQTCLTSLPPSTNASALASPTGRARIDLSGATPPTLQESRSGGALSASTSRALGPTKPTKRRSRASRRVPTTVLEATSSDFRDMVQRLTGIPPATSPGPVRPQPQRASPTTFICPDRPLPTASLIRPAYSVANSSILNFLTPTTPPAANIVSFDDILHPLHRSSSELFAPNRSSNIMRELEAGSSVSTPFSMPGSIMTTQTLPAPPSSWDWAAHELESHQINLPNTNSSPLVNEIIGSSGPPNISSAAGPFILPEDTEHSMSQFDAWLSGDDQ